jgi:hypothetical protein
VTVNELKISVTELLDYVPVKCPRLWFHRAVISIIFFYVFGRARLCDLVLRGPGYKFRGLGSIPSATRLSEEEEEEVVIVVLVVVVVVAVPVKKIEITAVRIHHADHIAPSIRKIWH